MYSLSRNVDKLSRNSDKLSRNVDILPYKNYCPEILIKCPEILIKNPTVSHRLIGPFNRLSFKKIGSTPLARPRLLKAGSSMFKTDD